MTLDHVAYCWCTRGGARDDCVGWRQGAQLCLGRVMEEGGRKGGRAGGG